MSESNPMQGWIGVDLDGTLAHYEGFEGPTIIGAPIEKMVSRVHRWLMAGRKVKVMTARVSQDEDGEVENAIEEWCLEHIGRRLEVTCCKDYGMIELWDDRVVQVKINTGERMLG